MAFDLDSFTFHLSEHDKEIQVLISQLSPVQFSAFIATSAGFLIKNKKTFMSSREAAFQVIKMMRGVVSGEFPGIPPPLKESASDDLRLPVGGSDPPEKGD